MTLSTISALGVQMLAIFAWGSEIGPRESGKQPVAGSFGPGDVRVALADNPVDFKPTGRTAFRNAGSPDVVRLPNGHLLAVIDDYGAKSKPCSPRLSVSRSIDSGQTWSKPRAVRFRNAPPYASTGRHGSLVVMPSGLVRLYFTAKMEPRQKRSARMPSVILSAITRNGTEYWFDSAVQIEGRGSGDLRAQAVWARSQMYLYLVEIPEADQRGQRGKPLAMCFTSRDGRRFGPAGRLREPVFINDVLFSRGDILGMYFATETGIRSMISRDGLRWRPEPGTRMAKATDAAIVKLDRDKHLMLYCTPPEKSGLARAKSPSHSTEPTGKKIPSASAGPAGEDPVVLEAWEPFTTGSLDAELGDVGDEGAFDDGSYWEDIFAPVPDFVTRVDYVDWYQQYMMPQPGNNAYDAYEPFLQNSQDNPEWGFSNMFADRDHTNPPAPWDPADYPEWEASYETSRELVEQFRDAALDPRPYGAPAIFSLPGQEPKEDELLIEMLMPHLSRFRNLSKATISEGWRMENGAVNPNTMRQSWETVMGNARHLREGTSIIENLVSLAEQQMVENTARRALEWDVFNSAEELEAALYSLQEADTPWESTAGWIPLEHAWQMDLLQYLVEPSPETGQPQMNSEHIEQVCEWISSDAECQRLKNLTVDDLKASAQSIDAYLREVQPAWETGYPAVRHEDIDAMAEEARQSNEALKVFLPSLARAYELQARGEASRRATQLSYGIHLFKKRHGRWPVSLDELPAEVDPDVRTDPFTGDDFSYRPIDDGFTLYSSYENAIDDGGVHNPDGNQNRNSESDDYVFWPPQ